jgi:hypothetical protein
MCPPSSCPIVVNILLKLSSDLSGYSRVFVVKGAAYQVLPISFD